MSTQKSVSFLPCSSLFTQSTQVKLTVLVQQCNAKLICTEAVSGIVGRAELLSAVFFLASLLSYSRTGAGGGLARVGLAAGSACLALLSKEVGITAIGLCLTHELFVLRGLHKQIVHWLTDKRIQNSEWTGGSAGRVTGLLASLAAMLFLRIQVMQGASLPVFTKFDNPASVAALLPRYLTFCFLPCLNIWLLLCPSSLCCDWTMGSVPLLTSLADPRILAILATIVMLLSILHTVLISPDEFSKPVLIATAWFIIPFIPASNLLFPVGFVLAERILYIPSMGFSLLVSIGFCKLINQCKQIRKLIVTIFFVMLFSHAVKTISRNFDWTDEQSIFLSGLTVNTKNAKLFNNVGHALESNKKYIEALVLFKEAARVQPDDIGKLK